MRARAQTVGEIERGCEELVWRPRIRIKEMIENHGDSQPGLAYDRASISGLYNVQTQATWAEVGLVGIGGGRRAE